MPRLVAMRLHPRFCALSIALAAVTPLATAAADFGFDSRAELQKLEGGNLKFLERVSLASGVNLRSYLERNHFRVIHELSALACFEKQVGNMPPGCTVSVNVALGPRVSNLCSTLLRWNQPSRGATFQPLSGGARILMSNPSSFVPSVQDMEARCR